MASSPHQQHTPLPKASVGSHMSGCIPSPTTPKYGNITCYLCGLQGHKRWTCPNHDTKHQYQNDDKRTQEAAAEGLFKRNGGIWKPQFMMPHKEGRPETSEYEIENRWLKRVDAMFDNQSPDWWSKTLVDNLIVFKFLLPITSIRTLIDLIGTVGINELEVAYNTKVVLSPLSHHFQLTNAEEHEMCQYGLDCRYGACLVFGDRINGVAATVCSIIRDLRIRQNRRVQQRNYGQEVHKKEGKQQIKNNIDFTHFYAVVQNANPTKTKRFISQLHEDPCWKQPLKPSGSEISIPLPQMKFLEAPESFSESLIVIELKGSVSETSGLQRVYDKLMQCWISRICADYVMKGSYHLAAGRVSTNELGIDLYRIKGIDKESLQSKVDVLMVQSIHDGLPVVQRLLLWNIQEDRSLEEKQLGLVTSLHQFSGTKLTMSKSTSVDFSSTYSSSSSSSSPSSSPSSSSSSSSRNKKRKKTKKKKLREPKKVTGKRTRKKPSHLESSLRRKSSIKSKKKLIRSSSCSYDGSSYSATGSLSRPSNSQWSSSSSSSSPKRTLKKKLVNKKKYVTTSATKQEANSKTVPTCNDLSLRVHLILQQCLSVSWIPLNIDSLGVGNDHILQFSDMERAIAPSLLPYKLEPIGSQDPVEAQDAALFIHYLKDRSMAYRKRSEFSTIKWHIPRLVTTSTQSDQIPKLHRYEIEDDRPWHIVEPLLSKSESWSLGIAGTYRAHSDTVDTSKQTSKGIWWGVLSIVDPKYPDTDVLSNFDKAVNQLANRLNATNKDAASLHYYVDREPRKLRFSRPSHQSSSDQLPKQQPMQKVSSRRSHMFALLLTEFIVRPRTKAEDLSGISSTHYGEELPIKVTSSTGGPLVHLSIDDYLYYLSMEHIYNGYTILVNKLLGRRS